MRWCPALGKSPSTEALGGLAPGPRRSLGRTCALQRVAVVVDRLAVRPAVTAYVISTNGPGGGNAFAGNSTTVSCPA